MKMNATHDKSGVHRMKTPAYAYVRPLSEVG